MTDRKLHSECKKSKPRKRTLIDNDLAVPAESFVNDVRYTCKTFTDIKKACGVSVEAAHRIYDRKPMRRPLLKSAMDCFYQKCGQDKLLLVQMRAITGMGAAHRDQLMHLLNMAARLVQEYGDVLTVNHDQRTFWVFPPRDALLNLVNALEGMRDTLHRIHRVCGEFDGEIFAGAEELLERLKTAKLKRKRAYGKSPSEGKKKSESGDT